MTMTGADLTALLKKHPLSLCCGLVAVACGVALYLRSDKIAESQATYEAKTAEANKMATNVRNSAGLAEQVAEIQAQRKDLESRLMKAGQLAVNLQYFYKLETETEVKTDVRQSAVGKNKAGYVPIPFSLSVQGTYPQLINFLSKLQDGRHLGRINSATMSKVNISDPSNPDTAMTLSLSVDFLGQP